MHPTTRLLQTGRTTAATAKAVNPPIVRASTTVFETLAEFKASYEGVAFETERYGRSGTSTTFEFQSAMADISNTESCIATASGLAAMAAVIGAHAGPGTSIAMHRDVYPPTRVLAETELKPLRSDVRFFDTIDELSQIVDESTALIVIEVPGSLTMSMLDVAAICTLASDYHIPVACDATWGTPLWFDAHGLGVDIAIHAATKYISGHSDVMLGAITGTYEALATTRSWCQHYGTHASPDSCWFALRGLRTLAVRLERHQASAMIVADWLLKQPQIKSVLFPGMPHDAGHQLWRSQFSGAPGPFTVELASCCEQQFANLIDDLTLFGLGTSWGGFESLVMPAIPHQLRHLAELPNDGRHLRLHIGLDHPEDLIADLKQSLSHIG